MCEGEILPFESSVGHCWHVISTRTASADDEQTATATGRMWISTLLTLLKLSFLFKSECVCENKFLLLFVFNSSLWMGRRRIAARVVDGGAEGIEMYIYVCKRAQGGDRYTCAVFLPCRRRRRLQPKEEPFFFFSAIPSRPLSTRCCCCCCSWWWFFSSFFSRSDEPAEKERKGREESKEAHFREILILCNWKIK